MSLRLVKFAELSDGRLIRILCGAEGDGDNGSGGSGDDGDKGGDPGTGGNDDDGKTDPPSGTVSLEELEKVRARMVAADRRATEYEKKIREFEDRDKSTEQRLNGQVETLTKENENLRQQLSGVRRDNAFLTANPVTWHDASIALTKIDWDVVTDAESGEVDTSKLKKEIERVAKENAYLVKSASPGENGKTPKGPSGHHPGGSGSDDKNVNRAAMEKKYPALRR